MSDIPFSCPHCKQHLESPNEMAGEIIACPTCQKDLRVPKLVQQTSHITHAKTQTNSPRLSLKHEVITNVKQGALIGGCVCFAIGILFMYMTLWSVFFYAPLFFTAFVLSIVAMAQRRIVGGILLLLGTLIIPPTLLFTVTSFKAFKSLKKEYEKQVSAVHESANTDQPVTQTMVTPQNQTTSTPAAQPEQPTPTIPELRLGEAVVIDEIKITFRGSRFANIEKKSMFGDSTTRSGKQYLIMDVYLENTSPGKIIYLQNIWEKTKITDDFGNIEGTLYSDRFMSESIVGFIGAAKMKPGESSLDMIIFDLPVDTAKQFIVQSDPGFWRSTGEDRVSQLSNSSFIVKFSRSEINQE